MADRFKVGKFTPEVRKVLGKGTGGLDHLTAELTEWERKHGPDKQIVTLSEDDLHILDKEHCKKKSDYHNRDSQNPKYKS